VKNSCFYYIIYRRGYQRWGLSTKIRIKRVFIYTAEFCYTRTIYIYLLKWYYIWSRHYIILYGEELLYILYTQIYLSRMTYIIWSHIRVITLHQLTRDFAARLFSKPHRRQTAGTTSHENCVFFIVTVLEWSCGKSIIYNSGRFWVYIGRCRSTIYDERPDHLYTAFSIIATLCTSSDIGLIIIIIITIDNFKIIAIRRRDDDQIRIELRISTGARRRLSYFIRSLSVV